MPRSAGPLAFALALSLVGCIVGSTGPNTVHGAALITVQGAVSCRRDQVHIASMGTHGGVTVYRTEGCGFTWVLQCSGREVNPCMHFLGRISCTPGTAWECERLTCDGDPSCERFYQAAAEASPDNEVLR